MCFGCLCYGRRLYGRANYTPLESASFGLLGSGWRGLVYDLAGGVGVGV